MARMRASGPGMFIVAVVFLGFAFLTSLIIAILLYTKIEHYRADADKAGDEVRKLATQTEIVMACLLAKWEKRSCPCRVFRHAETTSQQGRTAGAHG